MGMKRHLERLEGRAEHHTRSSKILVMQQGIGRCIAAR